MEILDLILANLQQYYNNKINLFYPSMSLVLVWVQALHVMMGRVWDP